MKILPSLDPEAIKPVVVVDQEGNIINQVKTDYFYFEDSSFVTGETGREHDFSLDSPVRLYVDNFQFINDGDGDIKIEIYDSADSAYGSQITIKGKTNSATGVGEIFETINLRIKKIRVTWVADSAYRVIAH